MLEEITAAEFPGDLDSDNTENGRFDNRIHNKGPEEEGLTLGVTMAGRTASSAWGA